MKLGGFGFTRLSKNTPPLWKLVGTNRAWMAPEIYELKAFTTAMDVFSLGLVFAFVLSDALHAFGNDKEEMIFNTKRKAPMIITIHQLKNLGTGATGIFDIIISMLSYDPSKRPVATTALNYFKQSSSIPKHPASPPLQRKFKTDPVDDDVIFCDPATKRESSEEPLPKKTRLESDLHHQQIPTPPLSASPTHNPHNVTPRSPLSDSSSSTVPLFPPSSETNPTPPPTLTPDLVQPSTSQSEQQSQR